MLPRGNTKSKARNTHQNILPYFFASTAKFREKTSRNALISIDVYPNSAEKNLEDDKNIMKYFFFSISESLLARTLTSKAKC